MLTINFHILRGRVLPRPQKFCIKKELQTGFEPVTSSLPRMRSTSWATAAFYFEAWGFPLAPLRFYCLSGRRGSNPPPIAWKAIALPNELLPLLCRLVGKSGLEPLNSEEDRFTVCCNCHYATSPLLSRCFPEGITWSFSSRWRDSNPRQADYKSATLPTELHRLSSIVKQLFSLKLRLQRYYFFSIVQIFFSFFLNH